MARGGKAGARRGRLTQCVGRRDAVAGAVAPTHRAGRCLILATVGRHKGCSKPEGQPMTTSTIIGVAAFICGAALVYLVVSRTLRKRAGDK